MLVLGPALVAGELVTGEEEERGEEATETELLLGVPKLRAVWGRTTIQYYVRKSIKRMSDWEQIS